MRILGILVALCMPLLVVMSPAQANQSRSGTVTATDPVTTIYQPVAEGDEQGCPGTSAATATANYDTLTYVAHATGLRTITIRVLPAEVGDVVLYLYLNGKCVAADYNGDNPSEASEGIVDLVNVPVKFGDHVKLVIAAPTFAVPLSWSATITEPHSVTGKAAHKTVGKAKKYIKFPAAISCTKHKAVVKLKKKAKKKAHAIVIKANAKKLKKVKKIKRGKKVHLRHIPAKTTKLKATVKLKSGKEVHASRRYNRCL